MFLFARNTVPAKSFKFYKASFLEQPKTVLPLKVGKSLVCFCHSMDIFLLLDRTSLTSSRSDQFRSKLLGHR